MAPGPLLANSETVNRASIGQHGAENGDPSQEQDPTLDSEPPTLWLPLALTPHQRPQLTSCVQT